MSSSGPKRQPISEALPFAYADAGSGGASDSGQSAGEQAGRQQAEVFEQGRQAGQQQLRAETDAAVAKNRAEIGRALQEFAMQRQSYYRRVEAEVVALALAVARKILHREAQIDPQALAGIVRVTLEKLDLGTKVALHVPPQEASGWRRYFACEAGDFPAPEIREDPALAAGECRIESSLGATDVGVQAQLKEIETGLLDLLGERPGSAPGVASGVQPASNPPLPASPPEKPRK
jgi:flagellar assembly protein FliH